MFQKFIPNLHSIRLLLVRQHFMDKLGSQFSHVENVSHDAMPNIYLYWAQSS